MPPLILRMLFYTNLINPSKEKYNYQKLFKDKIYFLKCINLQGMILDLGVAANHFQISCKFEIDSCFVSPSLIASTMKLLPVTYSEESWIRYRTRDVDDLQCQMFSRGLFSGQHY